MFEGKQWAGVSERGGEKGERHANPDDPPRRQANTCTPEGAGKRPARGTYTNDRLPIIGTVGRESSQVRLRVVHPPFAGCS